MKKLEPTTVALGKGKKGNVQRLGFKDERGQVFIPPKRGKDPVEAWKKKMSQKGYEF